MTSGYRGIGTSGYRALSTALAVAGLVACGRSVAVGPADFDAEHQPCAHCRMVGSNGRFAAQIGSRQAEPAFFDDIGCLRDYLRAGQSTASDGVAYVADHRTGQWVRASEAVFVEQPSIQTPMGSHLMAYASADSRAADPDSAGARARSVADVFGALTLPGGRP